MKVFGNIHNVCHYVGVMLEAVIICLKPCDHTWSMEHEIVLIIIFEHIVGNIITNYVLVISMLLDYQSNVFHLNILRSDTLSLSY